MGQFYYFGYANANAYENNFSSIWNGTTATLVESHGSVAYGAIWKINEDEKSILDTQEGVDNGTYKSIRKDILTDDGKVSCLVYVLTHNPLTTLYPQVRPYERQPSKTYLNVIVNGAVESGLPDDYVTFLKSFKHNGKESTDVNYIAKLNVLKNYFED
ncbi:CLUMA_CG008426, isoform A [Clunio marinus]|uniref:gamma-glutamylcyclotransferase n=1 Tax=Clunio marinus TaxID=568069 RepID=A0A1J1I3L9_9DIPT|nr:CLUMA_CG008426, isoform A [Clunio marinus]